LTQKYKEDSSSHHIIDSNIWLKTLGENNKKRVQDLGHSSDLELFFIPPQHHL